MGLILGGVSASDLILDGQSVSLYVGGNPPTKVWPTREVVQITLGTVYQARDQFRAALSARGLNYQTVTEIPFNIELVGAGTTREMFKNCYALTLAPALDTSRVTDMREMFRECRALTYVPGMQTAQVTSMNYMFRGCTVLTDGNVRLFGRHEVVSTANMISSSGLTFEPFYASEAEGLGMHEVTVNNFKSTGTDSIFPLVAAVVPSGETWSVRIQGTITKASSGSFAQPFFRIGTTTSGKYAQGAAVDFSGTATAANGLIAIVINDYAGTSFTGTVTIEK